MGRVEDICATLGKACLAAVTQAGITVPAQFYIGAPFGPSLTKILTQNQYAVTVMPLPGGRRLAPRGKDHSVVTGASPTVHAAVVTAGNTTITLSGTPGVYNFNVVFNHPTLGSGFVYYHSTSQDTLSTIASAITSLLQAVGSPLTAIASGAHISIAGVSNVRCNVGTVGTLTQFQSRFEQRIQVSSWTPTAYKDTGDPINDPNKGLRSAVCDAIVNNVGTDMQQWYILPDGSPLRLRLSAMQVYADESQSDYNLYEAHMIFLAEYTLQSHITATQVGVIEEIVSIGDLTPIVTFGG